MKISARNSIPGEINEIENKGLIAIIKIQVTEPSIITAVITREAADRMKIERNDSVKVVIKPTEVMIQNMEK